MSMPTSKPVYEHILHDEFGVPYISGTKTKVIELVLGKIAHGWSAEELKFQFPFLTMGKIHSALAYYWDHQDELHQDIERRMRLIETVMQQSGESSLRCKLKSKGLL